MTIGEVIADKWKQPVAEDLEDIKLRIHVFFEYCDLRRPLLGDSGPQAHFDRMSRSAFKLCLLTLPMKAQLAVVFDENGTHVLNITLLNFSSSCMQLLQNCSLLMLQ